MGCVLAQGGRGSMWLVLLVTSAGGCLTGSDQKEVSTSELMRWKDELVSIVEEVVTGVASTLAFCC